MRADLYVRAVCPADAEAAAKFARLEQISGEEE